MSVSLEKAAWTRMDGHSGSYMLSRNGKWPSTNGMSSGAALGPVSQGNDNYWSSIATSIDSASIPSTSQVQATPTAHTGNGPSQNFHGNGFFSGASGFAVYNSPMVDQSLNISRESRVNGFDELRSHVVAGALYNSAERFDPPKCDEDTRVILLQELMDWVKDRLVARRILCMTGPAGSGKSALQQTTIEGSVKDGNLLAAFFFFAGDGNRNLLDPLIPTIAFQIAQVITEADELIILAVERNPTIFKLKMEAQAEFLIIEPLRQAMSVSGVSTANWPRTIFIDGIDECRGEENQSRLLSVVKAITLAFSDTEFRIKFLLASRPEYAMRKAISPKGVLGTTPDLLHRIELSKHDATSDIRRFLQCHLRKIGSDSDYPLPSTDVWPSDEDIDTLVDNASGQFIYAATVVKYLSDRRRSPFKYLQLILSLRPGVSQEERPFDTLDTLYANIFVAAQATYSASRKSNDPQAIVRYIRMLQIVEEQGRTITIHSLERIMSLDRGELDIVVSDLHSIVKSLRDHDMNLKDAIFQLRFHHKSVSDFLDDPSRSGPLFVSLQSAALEWLPRSMAWIEQADSIAIRSLGKFIEFCNPYQDRRSAVHLGAAVDIWDYCSYQIWQKRSLSPDDKLRFLRMLVRATPVFWRNIVMAYAEDGRPPITSQGMVGEFLARRNRECYNIFSAPSLPMAVTASNMYVT
ncbi:hypothetical protein FA15DRAFT_649727 [Coprinopsis marcescibilis]|uniref:Nephrocystin 3-like N-terminal domain-containing protein n=1 Tax=Coprinopsis marcescibilis TaxID=230819 RepID=A0A5C3KE80_COPMA|nr:hypothetical protein FA15DRAFT_649727 [Coprinopsis marcescibilis]